MISINDIKIRLANILDKLDETKGLSKQSSKVPIVITKTREPIEFHFEEASVSRELEFLKNIDKGMGKALKDIYEALQDSHEASMLLSKKLKCDYDFVLIDKSENISLQILIEEDFDSFSKNDAFKIIYFIKEELDIDGKILLKNIEKGSVLITLELEGSNAEELYLAIKQGKLNHIGISNAKLINFQLTTDLNTISETDKDILSIVKDELGENTGQLIKVLGRLISKGSDSYNIYINLSNRFNKIETDFKSGIIEYSSYLLEFNKITSSIIDFMCNLNNKDLIDAKEAKNIINQIT